MKRKLSRKVTDGMMNRAIEINKGCPERCCDFRIMTSPMRKKTLILRWTSINIEDIDKPSQCYFYECFNLDGTSQNCSVNYTDQEEANQFFESLSTHYKQTFAIDHKLEEYV